MKNYFTLASIIKILGYLTVSFFILVGIYTCFLPTKPFWLDEWFIIHNIKFRPTSALWGALDYMQQFPRVYLQLVAKFSSLFDFSYIGLRLPSFIVHTIGVMVCFKVGRRYFEKGAHQIILLVLIYISYKTSIYYYVQIKQYTMEMLLGLVALWQLYKTSSIIKDRSNVGIGYILLCTSYAVATFFSYTYPILFAPIVVVACLQIFYHKPSIKTILQAALPLLLGIISITIFYMIDVSKVVQDEGMQAYWQDFLATGDSKALVILTNIYKLFAHIGSGGLFEIVFGILGITGCVHSIIKMKSNITSGKPLRTAAVYTSAMVLLAIVLYIAGKLPLGAHRLNAFATAPLGLLALYTIDSLQKVPKGKVIQNTIYLLLVAGLAGNVFSSYINEYKSDEYKKKLRIYNNASNAIVNAQQRNVPLLVNRELIYPHDNHGIEADWAVKTLPVYKANSTIAVYPANNEAEIQQVMSDKNLSAAIYVTADSYEHISN